MFCAHRFRETGDLSGRGPKDRRIVVSKRIKEEFENGKDYYKLEGSSATRTERRVGEAFARQFGVSRLQCVSVVLRVFHLGKIGSALARTLAAFLNPDRTGKNSFPAF